MNQDNDDGRRHAPLEIDPDEFRRLGNALVDRIAGFLESMPSGPVTPGDPPAVVRKALGEETLPQSGDSPARLLDEAADLLFDHSLFNSHPRFWGYITSPAAPIGILGDLLASAVNANVGAWELSPMATEIEAQTIRWIAEMIGFPTDCGGLLVSGGNMANFAGFLAARKSNPPDDIRTGDCGTDARRPCVYTSRETHTWIEKATDLFGLGADAVRWIPSDSRQRIDLAALERQIHRDQEAGDHPLMVIGTAGTVSTGAIDPLPEIAGICRKHGLWFHVDGAYGALAAVLPEAPRELSGLAAADSIALDPHKWLYSPLEVGCALVRDSSHLIDTFSHHPDYYSFDGGGDDEDEEDPPRNYHEYGLQNSRGFRALKVWLALRQVGRDGYTQMIREDIALSRVLHHITGRHPDLQSFTNNLSITTFRYVPHDLPSEHPDALSYLNELNKNLLSQLQSSGLAYLSNAVIRDHYLMRACIVNFRTSRRDIEALPGIVTRIGAELDSKSRPDTLRG